MNASIAFLRQPPAYRPRTQKRSRSAFTLIEIAIALSIFGITLVGSVAAVAQMHLLQETGRGLSVASFHAQKILEEIRLQADTDINTAKNIGWSAWANTNGCNTLNNENATVTFATITNNLTEVGVHIAWNTKGYPMTYQVITRIAGNV
ncbi:MAG: prepilin-type N-terminal cleavage/methylation domain-containing protein [Candidatus Omnitrophica bacterium]|nr:prepilin-type N-terminal cleavage/methylation domain-containing protein [Candidatus Omnitrophota bacterium]